jgi:hypothetical protein
LDAHRSEWHDGDSLSVASYVEIAIAKFPTAVGHRHGPTVKLIGKLCCSTLTDDQILEVGKQWLRHFEGQYGLTFEQALAQFQAILTYTRNNRNFTAYQLDILAVSLPPEILSLLDEVEEKEGKSSRVLVEVVMREWMLDMERQGRETRAIAP